MRLAILACLCACVLVAIATPCYGQVEPDPTDPDLDGIPGVMSMPENPQPLIPSILTGPGRLLIDRSHRGDFNIGGLTNFLSSEGWVVAEHPLGGGAIRTEVLAGYDILLVPSRSSSDPTDPYSSNEIAAIQAFLGDGRGLWVLGDAGPNMGLNALAQVFGITFMLDAVLDSTNNEGQRFWPTIQALEPHAITEGVGSYGYYLGACLGVALPAHAIGRADEDAWSFYCPVGSRPPTLAMFDREGRAVFAGDITPLSPGWWASIRTEERLLLQNIANWLLGDTPTPTSPTTWGAVKSIYR